MSAQKGNKPYEQLSLQDIEATEVKLSVNGESSTIQKRNRIVVIGSGAFGTAVSNALLENPNNDVMIWGINKDEINEITKRKKNSRYYNNLKLNKRIKATLDIDEALIDAEVVILAVPSEHIRSTIKDKILPALNSKVVWVSVSKGFDFIMLRTITEMMEEEIPAELNNGVVKLSGPTYAIEIVQKQPSVLVAASKNDDAINLVHQLFEKVKYVRIQKSNDIYGTEIASIVKNSLAIALGIIKGLEYEDNTTAFFFTACLNEVKNLATALKIKVETIYSAACLGDLYLTGLGSKSRNSSFGFEVGKKDKIDSKQSSSITTIEGLRSIQLLLKLSGQHKAYTPIIEGLYKIFYEGKTPSVVFKDLLSKKIHLDKINGDAPSTTAPIVEKH